MSDQVPQHDLHAERVVLSACLLDERALAEVRTVLKPADFYDARHRLILEAACALDDAGKPAQLPSVASWLKDADKLQQVTTAYLAEVVNFSEATARFADYAQRLAELAAIRRAGELFARLAAESKQPQRNAREWLSGALERTYQGVGIAGAKDTLTTAKQVTAEIMAFIEDPTDRADRIPTGLSEKLDKQIGGLRAGGLHLIAARPGIGKSAVTGQLALNVAQAGIGVAWFPIEMSRVDQLSRQLAQLARIEHTAIDQGKIPKSQIGSLRRAANELSKLPIAIDDNSRQTVGSIRAMVRRAETKIERKIGLVIVDYIQLIKGARDYHSDDARLTEVSNGLLALAKELNIPVVCCAQLNRNSESRNVKDHRPQLSDLRGCGQLEQDARTVVMLYREDPDAERGPIEFLVRKCRQGGRTGCVELSWDGPTMSVSEHGVSAQQRAMAQQKDQFDGDFDRGF